jgi:hypothetical protein
MIDNAIDNSSYLGSFQPLIWGDLVSC